jgi:hypothetical protein
MLWMFQSGIKVSCSDVLLCLTEGGRLSTAKAQVEAETKPTDEIMTSSAKSFVTEKNRSWEWEMMLINGQNQENTQARVRVKACSI